MTSVTSPEPAARSRRAVAAAALALAAALGMTACGEQSTDSDAAQSIDGGASSTAAGKAGLDGEGTRGSSRVVRLADGAERPRLRCPTDERSLMIADFAMGAKGAPTPEKAVGLSSLKEGEQMVVGARGGTVWIVRADGTAREEIDLIRSKGWLLHMRESCV